MTEEQLFGLPQPTGQPRRIVEIDRLGALARGGKFGAGLEPQRLEQFGARAARRAGSSASGLQTRAAIGR